MSIHIMRNILGRFNRKPSALLVCTNKSTMDSISQLLDKEDIDIRIASNQYNTSFFTTSIIVTDDVNDRIMQVSHNLHCPVLWVTDQNNITSSNNNLYITNINNLVSTMHRLIYQRFILK